MTRLIAAFLMAALAAPVPAQPAGSVTLFENVRIFDGRTDRLSPPRNVRVRGNLIERISADPIPTDRRADTTIIQGEGRTLMPGLIDAHVHLTMAGASQLQLLTGDFGHTYLIAGQVAEQVLMQGFTSVRDLAGPSFGLKQAINRGIVKGPRIWPSGAMISQTGGHGDFRLPFEVPSSRQSPPARAEVLNAGVVADGPDEVSRRVREQLMLGATQIKLAAGGGVASMYDPIDVAQYTEAEFRAAVEAAENWGTYVTVHAYTPRAIQTAIAGGVKVIDHGQLMDEETARLMAENGIWLSIQPFVESEFSNVQATPDGQAKQRQVYAGTENALSLARRYGIRTAFGTDTLFSPRRPATQAGQLALMGRWFSPAEALTMATSTNAELLALSGPRNPYPGPLGVVEEGALADLLLVEGNPLEDLSLIADPENNFRVIMKDGRVYKNTLQER